MIIFRALPIVLILVGNPRVYKSIDWGNYDFVGRLVVREFGTSFLFNFYLYGLSDFIERLYTPSSSESPKKVKSK